jgi:hypothetical protein
MENSLFYVRPAWEREDDHCMPNDNFCFIVMLELEYTFELIFLGNEYFYILNAKNNGN